MTVEYEWDVEQVADGDTEEIENEEVIDHFHQSCLADCLKWITDPAPTGSKWRIVLVRDSQDDPRNIVDRAWAYIDNGKLPEYFEDAFGMENVRVPKRFHKEVEKVNRA